MISFGCPSCGKSLKAPDEGVGREGRCSCGATFTIPRAGETAEPIDNEDDDLELLLHRRRRRKKSAPPALVIGAVLALGVVTFFVVILALTRDDGSSQRPKASAKSDRTKVAEQPADEDESPRRQTREDTRIDPPNPHEVKATAVLVGYAVFAAVATGWLTKFRAKKSDHSNEVAVAAIRGAVLGAVYACGIGLVLSQYWPVFGSIWELNLAQPWSPARINLIPIHLFAFGVAGAILGGIGMVLMAMSMGSGTRSRS